MTPREMARQLFRAALDAADAERAVADALSLRDGSLRVDDEEVARPGPDARVAILAAGKAAAGMARAAVAVLGERVDAGVVAVPHPLATDVPPLTAFGAGHPFLDAGSLAAAGESLRLARSLGEGDLLVCLVSGGASALWAAPPPDVSLDDLREVSAALMRAGVDIGELNTVRRQLSAIAGGRLARAAAPARVVTLAISDVIGAPPATIGSGPTVADDGSPAEALDVLARHQIDPPPAVLRHLQRALAGDMEDPARPDADQLSFHLLADLGDALEGARAAAEQLGLRAEILSSSMTGEARAAGAEIAGVALRALRTGEGPRVLIWGGETTVTVRGSGRGGRAQELALAAARLIDGEDRITILACGTDGIDGPTPAAGALVDGGTVARARAGGFDPDTALAANDSYPLLRAAGDLVVTGATGTNVGDVVIAVIDAGEPASSGGQDGGTA
jgi:glycerate 2-kinase